MSKEDKVKAALTRQQAENSKKEWERLGNLHKVANAELTQWGNEAAPNSLLALSNLLAGDLDSADNLWQISQQIKLVTNNDEAYKRKILTVETLISRMETEILNTPSHLSQAEGAITAEDRQHEVGLKYNGLQVAREVYNEWETRFRRARAAYRVHSHMDGTPKTEPVDAQGEVPEDPGAGTVARRSRSRERNKPGNDAKSLKPDTLSIDLPARQVHDWFRTFENYRMASGWSQDDHNI